ncbi:hypothetical protein CMZ84_02735 [Lysobacteraceae bacterium NML93-0399]|nr:hypothetical protein CMZ84_02735 [Xanthomonadaceae bacterium NML93-0399]
MFAHQRIATVPARAQCGDGFGRAGRIAERDGEVAQLATMSAATDRRTFDALLTATIGTAERWHGVRRIELEVYVDNAAATALYERHGFVREGLARGYALRDGSFVDVLLMARLALA